MLGLYGFENDFITQAAERLSKLLGAALLGFGTRLLSLFDEADLLVQNQPYQSGKPVSDYPDGTLIAEFKDGPVADARRARAFPLIAEDPTRQPDSLFAGPDMPADEAVRKRFFAET